MALLLDSITPRTQQKTAPVPGRTFGGVTAGVVSPFRRFGGACALLCSERIWTRRPRT